MFAPPVAKAQTKAAGCPANKLAPQRSAFIAKRFGAGAFEQGLREQEADRMRVPTGETAPSTSWSFANIPVFSPARVDRAELGPVRTAITPTTSSKFKRECSDVRHRKSLNSEAGARHSALAGHHNPPVPPIAHEVLRSPGQPLDAATRAFFEPRMRHEFSRVRVHTDAKAAASALAVNAIAYTVGQHVVFGQGQFAPYSAAGRRLLAHELAHTVQQRDAIMPSLERLEVSSPDDDHEHQAERVVQAVVQSTGPTSAKDGESEEHPEPALAADPMHVARLQRVISFTTADGVFTPNNVVANEDATGFTLSSPDPTFQWQPDVTIHGEAGDVFADWEVAHHQVGKGDWLNVWWGTGADRTHRHQTITGGLPIRDATAAGNTWYSDWRAQGFTADGDVRSPVMHDTPSERIPWANPLPPRGGTRGWFNFGLGFVSTLSARHIPDGTGAAAFRHLAHVHWNFSVDGTFDTTLPVPGRVTLNGGAINTSRVIPGFDPANRPMHGGPIFSDNIVDTDT
jgi:hypothetical protein